MRHPLETANRPQLTTVERRSAADVRPQRHGKGARYVLRAARTHART
eukprot:CAMPEP_0174347664 /NCGR_PEP_ID=MMETSP0811_2-20130205/3804_1 /TAXON_ID=73025 ORGANISM="Eutreptiella gymnastica-like, Strain CCMP1594" /NCGR_SAMPLE_ID=MMETSP0811_2 /ASSEMBLY_ACC=CAM_ASM_000667 /LENGTH=46 /DNA_ID= /DNA_START= /DNA_END= /DNA_ORIENTATION=